MERAVILSETQVLQPEDFFFSRSVSEGEADGTGIENLNLEEMEEALIRKALLQNAGNVSRAAKELGLTRASLYRRMEKYGL